MRRAYESGVDDGAGAVEESLLGTDPSEATADGPSFGFPFLLSSVSEDAAPLRA